MQAGWRLVGLALIILGVAFAAERLLVPDIVPVGYADEPQPSWVVEIAFVLRTIELMAAQVALIAAAVMLAVIARRCLRRRAL